MWARYYQSKYFKSKDAEFHKDIDSYNIEVYRGEIDSFTDVAFRGGAKTARTKLFLAYAIANDLDHFRKYIKILSEDATNSGQIVTDVYNIFVNIREDYPEIFQKTDTKREETMRSFTTSTSVKVIADTVGTGQRGALQDDARPDFIWFEDIENRKTLRSAVVTNAIWDNMEEARLALSKGGGSIYTCNYISEAGNVHKLVEKGSDRNIVMIIPIVDKQGNLAWADRFNNEDVEKMKEDDDDFEGEKLCEPSASADIIFDREILMTMEVKEPIRDEFGFKIYEEYDETHIYASGHDVAGGVGLDSSTSVFVDFTVNPARVVATYAWNLIKPEQFGEEIYREQTIYGNCVSAPENNYGTEVIGKLKQLGANIYVTEVPPQKINEYSSITYGWNTNDKTKSNALLKLSSAIKHGLLVINDKGLLNELKSYSRNDLLAPKVDPRLTTRHFDLLMALAIAWQMKDYAPTYWKKPKKEPEIRRPLNAGWVAEQNKGLDDYLAETYLDI